MYVMLCCVCCVVFILCMLCCIYIVYVVLYLMYMLRCTYSYTCMLYCIFHSGKEEWLQPIAQSLNYKSNQIKLNLYKSAISFLLVSLIFVAVTNPYSS